MKETIVVKIGTKLLVTKHGKLDLNNLRQLSIQLSEAKKHFNVILVSSGSIISGAELLNITPETIPEKQAAAALGQILLMKEYSQFFEQNNTKVAQLLLTKDNLYDDVKKINVKNTIETLLQKNIIPIINENDTVATDEIQFGDNDILSSHVAFLMNASRYIILTDQDGIYTANPNDDKTAKLIPELISVTNEMISSAPSLVDTKGKGGIKSKLMAAQFTHKHGILTFIANGRDHGIIMKILNNEKVGTCIKPI